MRSVADAARRARTLSLKVDACTYEGLHVGVPSLLGLLRRHGVRASFFLAFGPDKKLYVPFGAPCNICEPPTKEYAQLRRYNADGSGMEVVARGVRNTVGFDWQPQSKELWFTDNGRDWLGDDAPPSGFGGISAFSGTVTVIEGE